MRCREAREQLNRLCDGERLASASVYAGTIRHCLGCAGCRAAWRLLKRQRQLTRRLLSPPTSAGLRKKVLGSLPLGESRPVPAASQTRRGFRSAAAPITAAAVLAAALVAVTPWKGSKTGAAAVEAAVQGANTWHLVGWKVRGGQRMSWEIWGRRTPFFYREQIGDELNFDDGHQRVRVVSAGQPGKRLALRLESGPAPSDPWREWMTMGTGWRQARAWHETREGILVFSGSDYGMQGPYTAADTYFMLDKRSWLPIRYEYRQRRTDSKVPAWVGETLQAQYDVAIPNAVASVHLPPDVVVVDTLSLPTDPSIPTEDVQRAHGLTVQVAALAMDPDGNVLVRVRSWLGNLKLGAEGTATWNSVETDIRYRDFGKTHDTAFHTDDGSPYVEFQWPRVWLDLLSTGDALKLLAPLEPRPNGAALPRSLSLDLEIAPQVMAGTGSSILFRQEFVFTVPLPIHAAPIKIDDYLPPGHQQRIRYAPGADSSTLEANIADARARQYGLQNDFDRALYWQKQGLSLVPPFTSTAQFHRLDVAHTYQEAGDRVQAAQWYREVIAVSKAHPETWNYYAWQARKSLEYMATHKPRRQARKLTGNGRRVTRASAAHSQDAPRQP